MASATNITTGGSKKANTNQRQPTRQFRQRKSQSRKPVPTLKIAAIATPARLGPKPAAIISAVLKTGNSVAICVATNPIAHDQAKASTNNARMVGIDRVRN